MRLAQKWLSEALYRMWSNGISRVAWLRIVDDPAPFGSLGWGDLIHSGFYFHTNDNDPDNARAKGTLKSFRFPFVSYRTPKGFKFWGRTPDSGRGIVKVQLRLGLRWRTVVKRRSDENGIFIGSARTKNRKGFVRAIYRGSKAVPFSLKSVPDRYFRPFGGD